MISTHCEEDCFPLTTAVSFLSDLSMSTSTAESWTIIRKKWKKKAHSGLPQLGPAFANLITWKYCLEVTYIYIRSKAVVSIAVFAYNAWIKAICSCGSAPMLYFSKTFWRSELRYSMKHSHDFKLDRIDTSMNIWNIRKLIWVELSVQCLSIYVCINSLFRNHLFWNHMALSRNKQVP